MRAAIEAWSSRSQWVLIGKSGNFYPRPPCVCVCGSAFRERPPRNPASHRRRHKVNVSANCFDCVRHCNARSRSSSMASAWPSLCPASSSRCTESRTREARATTSNSLQTEKSLHTTCALLSSGIGRSAKNTCRVFKTAAKCVVVATSPKV